MGRLTRQLENVMRGTVATPVIIKTKHEFLPELRNHLLLDFRLTGLSIPRFSMFATVLPSEVIDEVKQLNFVETCFSEDTEILTEKGWKRHTELDESDRVMTFSKEKNLLELQSIKAIISYHYTGTMISFRGKQIDLLVTPDHRILFKEEVPWTGKYLQFKWNVEKAGELKKRLNTCTVFDRQTQKHYCRYNTPIKIPCAAPWKENNSLGIPNDIIALGGWIITEGHYINRNKKGWNHHGILISQDPKTHPHYYAEIRELLERLNVNYSIQKDHQFYIKAKDGKWIREILKDPHSIPHDWLESMSFEQLRLLQEILMKGDGSGRHGKNGKIVGRHFITKRKELADSFQELCTKLGFRSMMKKLKGKEIYTVSYGERAEQMVMEKTPDVPYNGVVWCVSTENGFVVVRRNGKVAISGNCYLDREVRIPEIRGASIFTFDPVQRLMVRLAEVRARKAITFRKPEWVPTSESRKLLEADIAGSEGYEGQGVKIGIVDTDSSIRYQHHPQLSGRVTGHTVIEEVSDKNGHGGHVATTALGSEYTPRLLGLKLLGVAPRATGLGVKVLRGAVGMGSTSDVIKGVEYAAQWGAQVINLSLGGSPTKDPAEDPMFPVFQEIKNNIITCAAIGNEGPDSGTTSAPGSLPNVLSVGAIDIQGTIAKFSSRGPTPDDRTKPDIVAPGVNIFSGITLDTYLDHMGDYLGNAVSPLSGTSMATPHVTGLIALAIQLFKQKLPTVPLTTDLVLRICGMYGQVKDNVYGWGQIRFSWFKRYIEEHA